jgi:hypothetical protein
MVPREGSAPSTSGCRPDVMLLGFPSLASQMPERNGHFATAITTGRVEARPAKTGCRGWNRTSIRAFKGRCPTIRRPGKWWLARITLPVLRIKSPLHHFNACEPKHWCSGQDSHLHWRRSRRRASANWATRAETGASARNGLPKSCKSGARRRRSLREMQCTELIRLPSERIAEQCFEGD